mmetsp:Transcript_112/g.255  ORF Transcript_112/g.255 Transcript_112/m.255 type:complete len:107 (-) Transcript_112:182-502(-)
MGQCHDLFGRTGKRPSVKESGPKTGNRSVRIFGDADMQQQNKQRHSSQSKQNPIKIKIGTSASEPVSHSESSKPFFLCDPRVGDTDLNRCLAAFPLPMVERIDRAT